ncbi:hypothetical protein [Streptomyces sp. NBC_00239]|uniref:hypothetical protein n=1 Tax=Streptomyces sp. NBC_00239 TaxID=2903640 RepID=UPI002E280681|nr:hypothetical protein [Streptomyces sp. NBC_00239]
MLTTDSPTDSVIAPTGPKAADLPTAMAEAAHTADAYRVQANRIEAGLKGAPDPTWLRSQSAICLARQKQYTDCAQGEPQDRDAANWQALALGYAEAARILAAAGAEGAGRMVPALLAATALLKAAPSRFLRPACAAGAAPAYIDMAALNAAHIEASEYRTARTLHTLESELLLLACYARDHNPPMLEALTQALAALAAARDAGFAADPVAEALDAVAPVLCHAVLDPILTTD